MKQIILILALSIFYACQNETSKKMNEMDQTLSNKALVEQYFQHFNTHDWEKMAGMYTETAELKDPAYGVKAVQMSRADIIKKYKELHAMIPDVQDKVLAMYHSGNTVIVEFVSSGTAPDSTKFELPICTIFEIKKGLITKDFTYYDNFGDEPK